MENHLFELRISLFLAALLLFWLIGVTGMWLRRAGEASMRNGFFVSAWIVLAGLVSLFGFPLYGAGAILPAAVSVALSLTLVYLATNIGDSTPRGWRAIALAGGAATLATVLFPVALLFATAILGVDGP